VTLENRFLDKILICIECREEFVFTVAAQEYFAERGFLDEPKRCKSCYTNLKKGRRRLDNERFGSEPRDDNWGEGLGGVGVLVWRWPPDGHPPRFLCGHAVPPSDFDQDAL
jgi:hypothetical protein